MRIITNEALIRRNARIGQITSLIGLIVLLAGTLINFRNPEETTLLWGAVLVGFLLSQIGIYFGNRFVRRPRPDELINTALKGMNRQYTMYHYSSPVSHLLVGPAGAWVMLPYHQRGKISYQRGRWRHSGGPLLWLQKIFAQEGIGHPGRRLKLEIDTLQRELQKRVSEPDDLPDIQGVILFTNESADIDVEDSPAPAMPIRKLKEFIRKRFKEDRLSAPKIQLLIEALENHREPEGAEQASDRGD